MKKFSIALVALVLPACTSITQPTPEKAVKAYIQALESGNTRLQQEYRCFQEAATPESPWDELKGINRWEILGQEQVIDEQDANSQYNLVSARIKYASPSGFLVTRIWKFTVWDSDELFEMQKRLEDKTNRILAKGYQTINKVRQITGEAPLPIPSSTTSVPERTEITSQPYCITIAKPI